MDWLLGFDVGGTKLAVTLGRNQDGAMNIAGKRTIVTAEAGSWENALGQMADCALDLLAEAGLEKNQVAAAGVSCGGPLDSRSGMILSPPNLPGWDDVPAVRWLTERLEIPVFLQNDADACALAEWRFGAGKGCENMVFLTFGTGFGAGLILNGQLYAGTNNAAGEIGHCRAPALYGGGYGPSGYGKIGSFEGFCSGGGIAELGRSMVLSQLQQGKKVSFCPSREDFSRLSARSIAEAASAEDPLAIEIYRQSGRQLGAALALLVDLLNPEVIVIGSIYARSEQLLREEALRVMEAETLWRNRSVCRVLPAVLGDQLGDIAALSIAYDHVCAGK